MLAPWNRRRRHRRSNEGHSVRANGSLVRRRVMLEISVVSAHHDAIRASTELELRLIAELGHDFGSTVESAVWVWAQ